MSDPQPYITPGINTLIQATKPRVFATRKLLRGTQDVEFYRDANEDGIPQPFGPYEVVVDIPDPTTRARQGQASAADQHTGEFQSDDPGLDVQQGDTFTLDNGATGRVTSTPFDAGAYWRIPFELEG